MEDIQRKKLWKERRKLQQERRKKIAETIASINNSIENRTWPENFLIHFEKYTSDKMVEIRKPLFEDFSSRQEFIEQWNRIKTKMLYENFLVSPLGEGSSLEQLQKLPPARAVSLGAKYLGNCVVIIGIDNYIGIGKGNFPSAMDEKTKSKNVSGERSTIHQVAPIKISEDYIQKTCDAFEEHFSGEDRKKLRLLLQGEEIASQLLFDENCNHFVFAIRLLNENRKITKTSKRNIQRWISKNFLYLNDKGIPSEFDVKEVYKVLTKAGYTIPKDNRIIIEGLKYKEPLFKKYGG